MFARYKCKIVDKDIDNFVLPDANKLIKALQCSDNDELGLNIENNYIHYKNKNFKFKYFLFDRSIKKSNDHVYTQLSKLEDEYDTKFSITKEDLKTFLDNIKYNKYEFVKLNVEYWIDLIRETNLDSKEYAYKKFSSFIFYYFNILHSTRDFIKSKFKILKYFIQYPWRLIKK